MSISQESEPPSRRQFCALACQAASLVAAGTLIQACGGSPSSPGGGSAEQLATISATVSGRVVSITVPSSGTLSATGSAALANTSIGSFLIARTGDTTFSVLTATCTHEACTVSGFGSSQFVCPCHGSRFTTTGAVVTGPAPRALTAFASNFTNGTLTFTA